MSLSADKRPGRPALTAGERAVPVRVSVTERDRDTLSALGSGNVSLGVRHAVALLHGEKDLLRRSLADLERVRKLGE